MIKGLFCALIVFCAFATPARSSVIGLNFAGADLNDGTALNGGPYAPPDTMGSVGPTHVVEFINGVYAVYDKATGALVGSKISDTNFWLNAGVTPTDLSDPRITYDSQSGRWFATEVTTSEVVNNHILIARSNTSDPTAGWKAVSITPTNNRFADFPTMGLDANGLYVGSNDYDAGGNFQSVSLYSVPKADLVATTPSLSRLTSQIGRAHV